MSVQLIVYPQNFEGQFNAMSSNANEFVVNGINFSGLDLSSSYDLLTTDISDVILNAPPTITNTWYRFRSTILGTPTLPIVTAGDLVLNSTTTLTISGVYQSLTNLTVGQIYNVTIDISTTASGSILVNSWNGTTQTPTQIFAANTSQVNASFTASATNITLIIYYYNNVADNVTISTISVLPSGVVPSGAIQLLENGQVICDLYEDEDLPLTLSVDDFKNVAEKVQSYSKAFNLPSTKRNNRIFDHIFEITRSDDGVIFNPYKRTQCVLKQDGFILFEGFLRMLDVTDKEGEISYNVNLYSEAIALADTLKDRAFRDLDFTELEHDYNRTQIKNSWNDGTTGITYTNPSTSGFRDAYSTVKYPFVDWNHQILVGGGSGTAATDGNPEFKVLEQMFRPFINIKYLIDRIFQESEFTYESTFFNTTDFEKLYMDFNWGGDTTPTTTNQYNATWSFGTGAAANVGTGSFKELRLLPENLAGGQAGSTLPPNYDTSAYIITATTNNEIYNISYNFRLFNADTSQNTVSLRWLHNTTAIDAQTTIVGGGTNLFYTSSFQVVLQTGDTLKAQFNGNSDFIQAQTVTSSAVFIVSHTSVTTATLNTLRGELGQWDFLKGLMTMFNLVTLVDEDNPNNILIEPYADVFINSTDSVQLDWTDKIDVSEMKLTPLTDLNRKTIFKFVEDDDDYPFNYYKNQVGGHLYGSKKFNAGNEFNILFGEDEIVAEPFAATIVKPLMSQFHDFVTPAIYAYGDDGVWEGFENSPRIMYNNGIKDTGASYFIPAQNGVVGSAAETDFLQFSHLSDVPTIPSTPTVAGSLDFHFGECQLMPSVGLPVLNNLFNLYWLPHYLELYNPNTRIMTIKVNLSPSDINTFKFNDTVYLKNRVFRVNKIDYKPNDLATVEFILTP